MNNKQTMLDLDELFGQARVVKVKWKNREYEFLRIDGITPKQAVKFQKLQAKVSQITLTPSPSPNGRGESDDAQDAVKLEEALDEMLQILCQSLPLDDVPFGMKLKIIEFYGEETSVKKKATEPPAPIGATPSAN